MSSVLTRGHHPATRPDEATHPAGSSLRSRRRRLGLVALVLGVVGLTVACDPAAEMANHLRVNQVRAESGLPALARSTELDAKARAQADRMAAAGSIFHSSDLAGGVSPGWRLVGENVAVAGSIAEAQAALEQSQPHLQNILNPTFTEIGVGVTNRDGRVYVVQVYVGR